MPARERLPRHRVAFGRRVRELRTELGLSQEDLAERAGLHRNYVGGIERGERNVGLDNIHKLARALRVEVTDLFGRAP
jgi:transcriptional regulator with XRE-family HTH domain